MLCPNCGSYIEEGESYCPNCCYGGSSSSHKEEESKEISREEYFYRLAEEASIKKDHSAAIKFYEKSLGFEIERWDGYSAIAGEYEAMGDYDSARRYWDKCRKTESRFRNTAAKRTAERGDFLSRMGDYEEALDVYENALNEIKSLKENETGIEHIIICAKIIHSITELSDKLRKEISKEDYQNVLKHTIPLYMHTCEWNGVESKAYYLSEAAWELYADDRLIDEALILMDSAIEIHPDCPAEYYNEKAIILDYDCQYDEALRYYDEALSIEPSNETFLKNKMGCIKSKLEMKVLLDRAELSDLALIDETIEMLPETLDNGPYFKIKADILDQMGEPVKASITRALGAKRYDEVDTAEKQLKTLNPSRTYINITGIHNYQGFTPFKEGTIVKLIKEPDNPHDRYAIRVELKGETVGYVANSEYTLIREVKSARDINDTTSIYAEVQFILLKKWIIAKLI